MSNKKIVLSTAPEAVITRSYAPPLGLLYVAAALEKEGFKVSIIDAYIEKLSIDEIVQRVSEIRPIAFGVTGTTENRFNIITLLNKVKGKHKSLLTFWGGPHASLTYMDTIRAVKGVDVIIKGEGEVTTVEMIRAYLDNKPFEKICGLTFRDKDGQIIDTPPRAQIQDIDSLPWPARHLLDIKKCSTLLEGEYKTQAVGVISSRGCPFECTFCANVSLGRRMLRKRSPKTFVDEIEFLHKNYGYRGYDIWDDTLTIDKNHVIEICNEIINRKLDIIWYARARVDSVSKEMLQLMRRAGCVSIGYGIESGSDRILKSIKKRITSEEARYAVKISAELGFLVKCFFILSLPQETIEDLRYTVDLIKEFNSYGNNVKSSYSFARIYPGTELECEARRKGLLSSDFSWSNYHEFLKSRLFEENPTIPLFENEYLSIEEIKAYISKALYTKKEVFKKGIRKIKSIKGYRDIIEAVRLLKNLR